MYYIRLVLDILLFVISSYFFIRVIYGKIKIHGMRLRMQEQGLIGKELNIVWVTFLSICFLFVPVIKFKSVGDYEHNKEAMIVNRFLLGFLIVFILFLVVGL